MYEANPWPLYSVCYKSEEMFIPGEAICYEMSCVLAQSRALAEPSSVGLCTTHMRWVILWSFA